MPKITALPPAAAITTDDLLPIVDSPGGVPVTQKATFAQLVTLLNTIYAPITGGLYVLKTGDTMTGLLTIAQATANTTAFASTGYSLTGANAQSLMSLAGTWNTSGNPTAFRLAITDTASGATSKLFELLGGAGAATSMLSVLKSGNVGIGTATPAKLLEVSSATGMAIVRFTATGNTANFMEWYRNGSRVGYWGNDTTSDRMRISTESASGDLILGTDAAAKTQLYTNGLPRMTVLPTSGNIGIGTTAPDMALEVNSATGANLRLTYNDSDGSATTFADFAVSSAGLLKIAPSGSIIQFGGTTSSFPALKRSTTTLQARLADDSAFASMSVLNVLVNDTNSLVVSSVAMANGAAAALGTLTNAPAAGNPTKWIPVIDNGTTRYIPCW